MAYLQVIGLEASELRMKKLSLKSLVIDYIDGLVTVDPESLVGQCASLQHLELGCKEISIHEADVPRATQASVPLGGRSCNFILQTKLKLKCQQLHSLLSLGFRSVPNNNPPPAWFELPNKLLLQYGAPEPVSPPQSIRSSLYYPFHGCTSTSFGRGSEEYTLLASKDYQAFLEVTPWSLCFDDKLTVVEELDE